MASPSAARKKIVICAAMKSEAAAIRAGLKLSGVGENFEVLLTGMGLKKARAALSSYLKNSSKPDLVISAGFAGAWEDSLCEGDWVSLGQLWNEEGNCFQTPFEPLTLPSGTKTAHLCSVSKIYPLPQSICEKFKRHSALPISVDMETWAEAQVCAEHQIAFQVLRYISDSPKSPLPHFLGDFVSFDISEKPAEKMGHLFHGFRNIVRNPRGVPQLLRGGIRWSRDLRDGWSRFAPALVASPRGSS